MNNDDVVIVDENGDDVLENGRVKTADGHAAHKSGLPHRAVSVFVFNGRGELLVQRRAGRKLHSAGQWSNTCCTHPKVNECPIDAATRRLKEEMGIDTPLREVFRFWYKADVPPDLIENEYDHVFIGRSDAVPQPDPREASDWMWCDVRDLRQRMAATPDDFTFWLRCCFERVCESARGNGLIPQPTSA
jgi:isopentenyl-diphosphate delta-isomerase